MKNYDILSELENSQKIQTLDINNILSQKQENYSYETIEWVYKVELIQEKKSFINIALYIIKYIITSIFIFTILLITSNYSAYSNIVKSYVFPSELEKSKNNLLNSVQWWNIIIKQQWEKENKIEQTIKLKKRYYSHIYNMKNNQDKQDIELNIDITPYNNRIIIPKIWKNIPLLDIKNKNIKWQKELNNIFMDELENWVIRYPGSVKPGTIWASFIFWHSSNFIWKKWDYNDVFALLDKVVYNDKVIVYYNQKKYTYKIIEKKVITPWDISVLKRNKNKSEITIMTCWPIWTTLNRLIVVWELIEK